MTPQGDKYLLLAGERRYWAFLKPGMTTIPAWIIPGIQTKDQILTIQWIGDP